MGTSRYKSLAPPARHTVFVLHGPLIHVSLYEAAMQAAADNRLIVAFFFRRRVCSVSIILPMART